MGNKDYFSHGDFNRICDLCGFKFKASETRKQWNQYYACPVCYEPRNPQDFVRGIRDRMNVEDARPDNNTNFIVNQILPDDL